MPVSLAERINSTCTPPGNTILTESLPGINVTTVTKSDSSENSSTTIVLVVVFVIVLVTVLAFVVVAGLIAFICHKNTRKQHATELAEAR